MPDINSPDFQRIVSNYNIDINPEWDNQTAINHVKGELQKRLQGLPSEPISLQSGLRQQEIPKEPEPQKGMLETFWDNFPVRRTLSEAVEGVARSIENIPYSIALIGTSPTNIKAEQQLEQDMFPVSQPLSEFNAEWAERDAQETAATDEYLASLSLSEKLGTPQWYAKHLGQTSARILPEILSLLVTKKPLSVGSTLKKASTKAGAKQLAKESAKEYLFNPTQIGARIVMNSAIEATQTRQEAYQMALNNGLSEDAAISFANRASRSANAMNALIYGVSDTASRFLAANQIVKGLSDIGKGKLLRGIWKSGGGLARNYAIETFLEEIPQSEVLRLSLETAGGGEVNLFDVYGPDTYKDVFSNPAKREIMAITAFMSPLMSIPDVVAAFKGEPSTTQAFDDTPATAPDLPAQDIPSLPSQELVEFNPSQAQLAELSQNKALFNEYAMARTNAFIESNPEMESLSDYEKNIVIDYIMAQSDPAQLLSGLQKQRAIILSQPGADPEVIQDIDAQIESARSILLQDAGMNTANAAMFEQEYENIVNQRIQDIDRVSQAFSRVMAKIDLDDDMRVAQLKNEFGEVVNQSRVRAQELSQRMAPTTPDAATELEVSQMPSPDIPTENIADINDTLNKISQEIQSINPEESNQVQKQRIVELAEELDGVEQVWNMLPANLEPGAFYDYGSDLELEETKFSDFIKDRLYGKGAQNIRIWEPEGQTLTDEEIATQVQGVEPQIDEQQVAQPTQEALTQDQINAQVDALKEIKNFNDLKREVKAVVPANIKIPNNRNGYIRAYKNHLGLQSERANFQAIKEGEKISQKQRKLIKDFIKDNGFIANDADMKSVLKEMGTKAGRIRPLVKNDGSLSWDQMVQSMVNAGILTDTNIAPDEFIEWLNNALTAPKATKAPKRKSAKATRKPKSKPQPKKKAEPTPVEDLFAELEKNLPPDTDEQFQFSYTEREGKAASWKDIEENIRRMVPKGSSVTDMGKTLEVTLPNGASFTISKDLDNIPGDAVGAWDTINMIMHLSGRSDQFTADHEYEHTAEQLVLDKEQRAFLRKKVGDIEKTADAYADWIAKRRKNFDSKVLAIFEQIKDFFAKFADMLNIKTKRNIFNVIREGKQLSDNEYTIAESFLFSKREPEPVQEIPSDKEFDDKIKKVRTKAGEEFDRQAEATAAQQAVKEAEAAQKEIIAEMQRDLDFIESLEKGLDGQKGLTAYKKYLMNLMKENRGNNKLLSRFKKIAEAVREATKKKRLEDAKAIVDAAIRAEKKAKKIRAIDRIAKWASVKSKDGRLQQKNLPFEVNQELKPILMALDMTASEVDSRLKELYQKVDDDKATEGDRAEIDTLELWGDINGKSLEEVDGLLKDIKTIYKVGRRRVDRERALDKAEYEFLAETANKDLGGLKSEEAAETEKAEKSAFRRFRDQPTFVNFAESLVAGFPELMEKAFGKNSAIAKSINNLVSRTSLEEIKQKNDWLNERNIAFEKIFNVTGNLFSKKIKTVLQQFKMQRELNPKDHDVTVKENGKRIKVAKLSLAQAYRMWQIMESKDTNTMQAAKNSGYDEQTKSALDSLMDKNPQIKEWAEYEVNVLYPKFWNEFIVPRYIERYNVEPPKVTGGYIPLEYSFESTMEDLVNNGVNPIKARSTTGNLIQRRKNSMRLKRSDGLMLLQNYLENNINVMTWTNTLRKLDGIFNSDRLKAIEQKRGKETKEAIQQHLKVLKIGNPEQVVMRTGFERMFHNVSIHFLGLNIASGFKNTIQASNWGSAYDNISDWGKWQGKWSRAYREIKENPELMSYLKTRFFDGSDIFMRTSMNAMSKFKGSPFGAAMALTKQLAYSPIQLGDAFATSFGIPYYSYRLDMYKKQGFSEQEAKAKAGADFAQAVERYQSPTLMENIPAMHLRGSTFTKFATMLSTGLLPAARQMLGGIRRLAVGEERYNALRDLSFALLVLPMSYTAAEAFVNIVRGQEDEEDKYLQRFLLNSLASPMSTLPITGVVFNTFGNILLLGHSYGNTNIQVIPALSPLDKLVKESTKWARKEKPTAEDDERYLRALFDTGAAFGGIPRQYKYFVED